MSRYRYSKWDGTQEILDLDAEELMDELSRDVLSHGNLSDIMKRMQRSGLRDSKGRRLPGLEELRERLKRMKQQQLRKYDLDSVVEGLREKLDDIVQKERLGIQDRISEAAEKSRSAGGDLAPDLQQDLLKKIEEMAERNRRKLDELPDDMAGKIKELTQYDFMDDVARQEFKELMDTLKQHAMSSVSRDLMQAARNMDQASLGRMKEMVKALNEMMEQKARGQEPDFDNFMSKFGDFFGPNPPQNFDELMERLQQQMAQAQSLMNSLSSAQRQELQDLLDSMLDDDTRMELMRLADNMQELFPMQDFGSEYPFTGDESVSYNEALRLMEKMQKMDRLDEQLNRSQRDLNLDVDDDLLKEVMGDKAAEEMERLRDISKALEEAGYIRRKHGQWELTPRGMRKIGQRALRDIFSQLKRDRTGGHEIKLRGLDGDKLEETRKYEPGDDFDIDLQKTIMNALKRESQTLPLKLDVSDFEIPRREGLTRTSTIIMLDLSLSMFLNGYFDAAKRTAFALESLIKGQYPRDKLHVIGFARWAREFKTKDLLYVREGGYEQGTNLQHALLVARRILAKERSQNSLIILITDGEPTAHVEAGRVFFQYPPTLRTLQLTMREVKHCTQKGIQINTFMFDDSVFASRFVDQMGRVNKGRVFFANADSLGKYVLVDYVAGKKKKVVA